MDERICKAEIEMQMQRIDGWTWWGRWVNWEIGIDMYTLPSWLKQ